MAELATGSPPNSPNSFSFYALKEVIVRKRVLGVLSCVVICVCLSTVARAQNIAWPTSLAPHPFAILFAKGSYWVTSYDFSNPDAIGTIIAVSQDGTVAAGPFSTGGRNPSGLAFDGSNIWVGHHDDSMGEAVVSKLDAVSGKLLLTVSGFEHVSGLAFDSATGSVWVSDQGANTVTKLRASDGKVVVKIDSGFLAPMGNLFDGTNVWIANFGSGTVTKMDAKGTVLGTFVTGSGPAFMASDASGNIWVTNYNDNTVTELSAGDGGVLGTFPTGASPLGITFDGVNILIANSAAGTITRLNPADGSSRGTLATAQDPRFIAVGAGGNLLVTNASANTITSHLQANPCGGGAFAVSGTSATCTYAPGNYEFVVPPDVTAEGVHVFGAQGGHANVEKLGGLGAYVSGVASVTPGYALVITVGGQGGPGIRNDGAGPCFYCAGGVGGYGGFGGGAPGGDGGHHQSSGQSGFAGGGGGGRSQVDFYANGEGHLYAGGGGGGGGTGGDNYCDDAFGIINCKRFPGGPGGNGGMTGSNGGVGHYFDGVTGVGGGGGRGASANAGGGGGTGHYVVEPRGPAGAGGSFLNGGGGSVGGSTSSGCLGCNGNTFGGGGGGGGGGGFYGGGGGAGGIGTDILNDAGGGGGGGGGSSLWTGPGVLAATFSGAANTGDGAVVIAWSLRTQTLAFSSAPPSPGHAPGIYVVSAYGGGSGNPIVFTVAGPCTVSGSTVSLTGPGTCTIAADQDGNGGYLAAAQILQYVDVVQDTTPPVITPTVTGTLGNAGWYTSDVQVSWTVTDPDSAISSSSGCGSTTVSADTTGITLTCSATSAGGTASQSVTVKRDATAPVVTATADRPADHNGWYNHALIVTFTATDATSSIASCDAAKSYAGPDTAAATVSGDCTDQAGNTSSGAKSFQYDATGPTVSATADRTADHNGWYNHALTINFSGTDPSSGIASCDAAKSYAGPDTAAATVSGNCTDQAGNTSSAAKSFQYDATGPAVTATATRAADQNGWYNHVLGITFNGTDATSGLAGCDPSKNYAGPDTAAATVSGNCTDQAGNAGAAALSFKYDATAPSVSYSGNAGSYAVDGTVSITCASGDNLSGVASSTCQNITGAAYSFNVGANTFSATATDAAGNIGIASAMFTVQVTTGSVSNLVQQFVANQGIANSLTVKLDGAKPGQLGAFKNAVAAQSGKALTPAQAALLTRLAGAL
jgi:hypothetical protein